MTRGEREVKKWELGKFPYDRAECGTCATNHDVDAFCLVPEHEKMKVAAREMNVGPSKIRDNPTGSRKLVLAFRKKFAKFYPKRKH
jgi:hypothetical protein